MANRKALATYIIGIRHFEDGEIRRITDSMVSLSGRRYAISRGHLGLAGELSVAIGESLVDRVLRQLSASHQYKAKISIDEYSDQDYFVRIRFLEEDEIKVGRNESCKD